MKNLKILLFYNITLRLYFNNKTVYNPNIPNIFHNNFIYFINSYEEL